MPEIQKMLVISTAHVRPETAAKLNLAGRATQAMEWCPDFQDDTGWIWHVGDENPVVNREFPEEFAALFSYAMAHGCDWIKLDRDAEVVSELPSWETKGGQPRNAPKENSNETRG